jgi:alanyl-tRNA synthetase
MPLDKETLRKKFAQEWQKHYRVNFLIEQGFERKRCKCCKRHFWTLDSEREVCADSTCVSFDFIGRKSKGYSLTETWDAIEKFFVARDHTSIARYPVVCRWRDDLFFTNASIIDFQPYVVTGEIDPPANPLIVPQACIRFGDIENVGVTGQHYTSFIMFGQHAFNSQKTGLFYWKNEALQLDFEYTTKVLGVEKEKLCFHEDVWAGGGTFGPCMEYCAEGLELGNCVFMQFRELPDGTSKELDTKVIDMGAGLERLAWYVNGTPTSYDIAFEKAVRYAKKTAGLKIDQKQFTDFARLAGSLDAETVRQRRKMAELLTKLGLEEEFLDAQLRPLQAIYACADHTKTVLYAVTDGMLPSNSGGGYNLRLILRRAFSLNEELALNLDFAKLAELHAKTMRPMDKTLLAGIDSTAAVLEEELKKFRESKRKAQQIVEVTVSRLKEGKRIELDDAIKLYESHGVPLEMLEQAAKSKGVRVELPDNFYTLVAKKNEITRREEREEWDVSKLPKTKPLFYEYPLLKEFKATVLGVIKNAVVLSQTAFYAEAGGQVADTGFIENAYVKDVRNINGVFLHILEDEKQAKRFKKGMEVHAKIEWKRRFALMQHHTAAHLLNAAARQVLGHHIWQAGALKTPHKAHLDLTHYRRITKEELRKIELLVNAFIQQNILVKTYFMNRGDAEKRFGFTLYQGGYVPGKELRIVEIPDIDVEACGGTHVQRTGDIGAFKIIKREGIQDGVERVVYVAGNAAIKYTQHIEELAEQAAEAFSVPVEELPKTAARFFNEWKHQRKQLATLQEKLVEGTVEELVRAESRELKAYFDVDAEALFEAAKRVAEKRPDALVMLGNANGITIIAGPKSGKNAAEELKRVLKEVGGKGGGNQRIARGRIENATKLKQLLGKKN